MIRHAVRVAALVSLVLVSIGCDSHTSRTPLKLVPPGLDTVMQCESWPRLCEGCADVAESRKPTSGFADIGVYIHVMLATIDQTRRDREYNVDRAWALAPIADAAKLKVSNVMVKEPDTVVEFWTRNMIHKLFGRFGKVNEIWKQYGIQLTLLGGDECRYYPYALRPDGLVRDSIPTPQTSTPWTRDLFRSINRLFTGEHQNALHVFLWWSVAEGDIADVNAVSGGPMLGGNWALGYSRSAARGGPAVWMGGECLKHIYSEKPDLYEGRCARAIAHEVGHTLGLHHVDTPDCNLMFSNPVKNYPNNDCKPNDIMSKSQRRQALREARDQFGLR